MAHSSRLTLSDWQDGLALLLLRLGLGWFLFVWAVNKILTPGQYQQLVRHFDGVEIGTIQVIAVALVQIVVCLLVIWGQPLHAALIGAAIGVQIWALARWRTDPAGLAARDLGAGVGR